MSIAKKLVSLFGCSLLCLPAFAEQSYIAKLAPESLLLDIDTNGQRVIAIGERGHVLLSTDGKAWEQASIPTISTLTAVDMVGEKTWVVGHDAVILHQTSPEAPWQIQKFDPEMERPFLDVLFFDEEHGIAVGAYGLFYRTTDGGASWVREMHPEMLHPDDQEYLEDVRKEDEEFYQIELASILPHINRVVQDKDTLYLAGEMGLLAKSTDLGRNWERMEVDYTGSFFDVSVSASGQVIAAGLRGNLFSLASGDADWVRVDSPTTNSFNSVLFTSQNQYVAMGNGGILVCSDDGVISDRQTDDGKALTSAVIFNERIIMLSAEGIRQFSLNPSSNVCQGVSDSL